MDMESEWIATDAKVSDKGDLVTLSFRNVSDRQSTMNLTLSADRWQRVMHLEWLLNEERKAVNHLANRNEQLWTENLGLRRSAIYVGSKEAKGDE